MSATADVIEKYAEIYVSMLQSTLEGTNSSASGELESSIEFKIKPIDRGFTVSMLEYWEYVDGGRPAGKFPPTHAILEWLSYPNVRDRLNQRDKPIIANVNSIAYLIGRKIAKEGTEGNEFVTNVVESDLTDEMVSALADATAEDIIELI